MRPDVVAVIPTYNERDNLSPLIDATLEHGYRVLVVDDGSPDGTGALADELARSHREVSVLHRPRKEGLGRAYAEGFATALGQGAGVVCEMDADFSHDPADLPRLVAAVDEGADLAIGSRYIPGGATPDWPLRRRWLSRGGNIYARLMLGLSVRDATSGFRAFRASILQALEPETCRASGYGFQVEMAWRATRRGARVVEVPIVFRDRRYGESKMRGAIVYEAMWLVTKWGLRRMVSRLPGWRKQD